jgi:hypothetical protein
VQPAELGGDQGMFVGLGSSQSRRGIQLHQLIFEHSFNIWLGTDTSPPFRRVTAGGQHLSNLDDTCRTLTRSGVRLDQVDAAFLRQSLQLAQAAISEAD